MNPDISPTAPSTAWRKSSHSTATGNCVEAAPMAGGVMLRHSKHPAVGVIAFSFVAWSEFLEEACGGVGTRNEVATLTRAGADTLVRSLGSGVELRFSAAEWSAFLAGAADGEFDFADLRRSFVRSSS